ncbi:hypothetical protein [Actinacidiphila glaucinigra]|uniref:hypothetical protein n=1 Tax=Actinacidiphila glaucinigra TaxID=235986 RepID=UPI00370FF524
MEQSVAWNNTGAPDHITTTRGNKTTTALGEVAVQSVPEAGRQMPVTAPASS